MAQRPTADFNIDPNVTSGTDLANILNRFQDAIDSGNSGSSRPAYLDAGGLWVREGDPMRLYLYDGTTDRELYNTTDGLVGGSQWKDNGDDIYYSDGNVGIKTDNPTVALEVAGQMKFGNGHPWVTSTNILKSSAPAGVDGAYLRTSVSDAPTPTYANSNDTDTGMFFPASDTLGFSTGGSEQMTIDANGNVGVGATSPSYPLHVRTTGTGTAFASNIVSRLESNGSGYSSTLQFSNNVDASATVGLVGSALGFGIGTLERMRIDDNGNVGIGMSPLRPASEAKEQLEDWKSAIEERMKAEPKADRSAVTQEITGFEELPTLEQVRERLERAAGDKLQVDGNISASGTVSDGSGPLVSTASLIETLSTLRNATKDEETLEGLRDAIGDAVGGLIQKFEAIQAEAEKAATMDIEE